MYIDTHAHLYVDKFSDDIDEVILRAKNNHIDKIMLPNIDIDSIDGLHHLSDKYIDYCYPMMGLHPCSVDDDYKRVNKEMEEFLSSERNYIGVGETGVDLYWDIKYRDQQIESFEQHIEWAKNFKIPIIIHSRDSLDLTIEIIESHQDGNLTGVFHCYNGTVSQCRKIADTNFYMGMGGVVTYKNAGLDDMIRYMPHHKLVLETDAPYLSPVPNRGKRNESSYIPYIVEHLSAVRNTTIEDISKISTTNALKLFQLKE